MAQSGPRKIFIICPVRNVTASVRKQLEAYVASLEKQGFEVHYPPRDTKQDDPTGGYEICRTNAQAILSADEVHIWYEPSSIGSAFDMGGLFMLHLLEPHYRKKIVILNELHAQTDSSPKNFFKVMRGLRNAH